MFLNNGSFGRLPVPVVFHIETKGPYLVRSHEKYVQVCAQVCYELMSSNSSFKPFASVNNLAEEARSAGGWVSPIQSPKLPPSPQRWVGRSNFPNKD